MNRPYKTTSLLLLLAISASAAGLQVDVAPRFDGRPLVFDSATYTIGSGQKISVTRLDLLLSDAALRRTDGTWIGQKDFFACLGCRDGKTNFTLADVPAGQYDRIRFHIGLDPQVNHGDAARWPAGHPLNPQVNGLYWSWSHEYVFLALEGAWNDNGRRTGFSYHLATDRELMTVELPVDLDLDRDRELPIALDVAKIFSGPNLIPLTAATATSHSRTNDLLAVPLKENAETAFTTPAGQASELAPTLVKSKPETTSAPLIAANATPYRFTFADYFPQPDLPRDNPITGEGVALGSKLFFDRRLSDGDRQACAACHHPQEAFAEPRRFSRGVTGAIGSRNAMPLENLAWKSSFFWDGRAATVRDQVLQPIQNPIEMHESLSNAVAKVAADPDYPRLFKNAFGSVEVTPDRIARALEQFLLVQVSYNSKFDRVLAGREKFTDDEARGYVLFNTEYDPYHGQYGADCFHCHGGPLFQSQNFANNGLDATFRDLGRYKITHRDGDQGKFAVPSLRNVAMTAPYMHDGRFRTLEEAVEHYCTGMRRSATLDPNLAKHPDGGIPLSDSDKKALVAFLRTLTDEKYTVPTAVPAGPTVAVK